MLVFRVSIRVRAVVRVRVRLGVGVGVRFGSGLASSPCTLLSELLAEIHIDVLLG